jgi:hypothetical protein
MHDTQQSRTILLLIFSLESLKSPLIYVSSASKFAMSRDHQVEAGHEHAPTRATHLLQTGDHAVYLSYLILSYLILSGGL